MMRRPKWLLTALLTAVIVITGCSGGGGAQKEEATPTPIPTPIVPTKPTYEIKRGEVVKQLEFSGRIAPVLEQELYFRTSGYVGTVFVKRDEVVEAGDVLAELEVTDLKNQLLQAEASLETAIANNDRRIAEAEASLQTAELRLEIAKTENPSTQVIVAEIGLERAQTGLSDAQEAYDTAWDSARDWELNVAWRKQALENERERTERGLHNAELDLRIAQAQYQDALRGRQRYQYSVQINEQDVELARLYMEQLEAGLDIAEIELNVQRLRDLVNDARLIAPFDGQVLGVNVSDGRAVEAYRPVIVIGELSEMEVSANLQGSQMEDLQEGMVAIITMSDRPGEEITSVIRRLPYPYGGGGRIGTDVEEVDESTRVSLDTPAADADLDMGDLVRVTVELERKDDVLWLPPQAIRTFEGRRFVVVQDEDIQRRVDVRVGIESEDRVEIEAATEEDIDLLAVGRVVIGP